MGDTCGPGNCSVLQRGLTGESRFEPPATFELCDLRRTQIWLLTLEEALSFSETQFPQLYSGEKQHLGYGIVRITRDGVYVMGQH